MLSFIGKYLVVSENGHEIVDLVNPNAKYDHLAYYVPEVSAATGGLLQNFPIDKKYNASQDYVVVRLPEMEMKMTEKREWAASVAIDLCKLWIVGGRKGYNSLNSTEFIQLGKLSVKGPDMPFTIEGHSMVQYDEK